MCLSRQCIAALMDAPKHQKVILSAWQNHVQIIDAMRKAEYNSRRYSRQIAKKFAADTPLESAAKVWFFLKTKIRYEAEPPSAQTVKELPLFIHHGYGDCKHFATFATGVLNALDVPTWFTFAGQDKHEKKPNHAYATAYIDKKLVIIDPCRKSFNTECRYYYKWDKLPI